MACQVELAMEVYADQIGRTAADFVIDATTWWAQTPSVNPLDPAVTAAQEITRPLIGVMLLGSVLVQAIRIMLTRKGEGLVLVIVGLIRFAVTSGLGLLLLAAALSAGDALSVWTLDNAVPRYGTYLAGLLTGDAMTGIVNVGTSMTFALLAWVLGLIQWLVMAFREAGLLVLAAMLPLAASGSLTKSTRGWLERIIPWLIALVVYKPAAALIYFIGFAYLTADSQPGGSLGTTLTGLVVMAVAIIAMPVLLRFFSWSGINPAGASGGSGFLGAVGALAMDRAYRNRAVDRAETLNQTGPGSQVPPTPGGSPPHAPGQRPPPGAAPAAARPAGMGPTVTIAATGAVVNAVGRMANPPSSNGGP